MRGTVESRLIINNRDIVCSNGKFEVQEERGMQKTFTNITEVCPRENPYLSGNDLSYLLNEFLKILDKNTGGVFSREYEFTLKLKTD